MAELSLQRKTCLVRVSIFSDLLVALADLMICGIRCSRFGRGRHYAQYIVVPLRYAWQVNNKCKNLIDGSIYNDTIFKIKHSISISSFLGWRSVKSGSVVLCHGNYHVPLFMSDFDIPVGLSNLFQRIAPVDNRSDLPSLNQFLECH